MPLLPFPAEIVTIVFEYFFENGPSIISNNIYDRDVIGVFSGKADNTDKPEGEIVQCLLNLNWALLGA